MNTDNNIHVFAQFIFDFEFAFKINRRECLQRKEIPGKTLQEVAQSPYIHNDNLKR